jgi:hypothetical protein
VYRCDLVEGVRRDLLCRFRYFGVPDEVDYTNIPWRNSRFDEDELTRHVATQSRAESAPILVIDAPPNPARHGQRTGGASEAIPYGGR